MVNNIDSNGSCNGSCNGWIIMMIDTLW
jgi:hypothetical protein